MSRQGINIMEFGSVLGRSEMKKLMAGSWCPGDPGCGGGGGGGCSGNWTIDPACSGYDGANPNAIVCFVPGEPIPTTVCDPPSGTNPQTACCG